MKHNGLNSKNWKLSPDLLFRILLVGRRREFLKVEKTYAIYCIMSNTLTVQKYEKDLVGTFEYERVVFQHGIK